MKGEDENLNKSKPIAAKSFGVAKSDVAKREEAILEFWRTNKIFDKSLNKDSPKGEFIFYEGPPTANGEPGIHHLEARAFKDAIPRYKTMRGYHVRRKGGWDTHGLAVEIQTEKELGLESKIAIEKYGIAAFNQKCKESVWRYLDVWNKFTERIGYWVDQENPYVTYHNEFIESVWNIVKKINDQNLLYKDYKVVPWCPRCGTVLSSHELAQGYEDKEDISVYVRFKLLDFKETIDPTNEPAYLLAWTTTPWTLPGNVSIAINPKIKYVRAKIEGEKGSYILAKELIEDALKDRSYKILEEIKPESLSGKKYKPLFDYYYKNKNIPNWEHGWAVELDDTFVTADSGTGVVHMAPPFGDDLGIKYLKKYKIPFILHVNPDGSLKEEVTDFAGLKVKEQDGNYRTDIEIIKKLSQEGLLFQKRKIVHTYPFCWRCRTALIYYARDSWYIRMSSPTIKKELIAQNQKINWEPRYIRDGRFGEWLREIKDWAISRERYWGTPLPVWMSAAGEKIVVDSIDTLRKYTQKRGNKYFLIRHGQASNNLEKEFTLYAQENAQLTEQGKTEVRKSISKFKDKMDIIISSPFERARQTTEIICEELKFPLDQIVFDPSVQEWKVSSEFEGKDRKVMEEYYQKNYIKSPFENFRDGESFSQLVKRAGDFIYNLEKKYQNKNILISGHDGMGRALEFVIQGLTFENLSKLGPMKIIRHAEIRNLNFVPLPHNENYELDLHRPYVDEVVLEQNGKEFRRTKEVMDVWLDSGAMPFAQDHYPFENKKWVEGSGYPADFISEAIDQTRGWFYTLHAIGVLMGRGLAYKNVICLGHLMDASGKKMSKSLGNVIDPWLMIEKYGVDTLRLWMYSINQPGESKNFDEKTVALLHQQVFGLLYNVLAFYELYRDRSLETINYKLKPNSNILDQWILARLDELIESATKNLDNYKLLEPTRAIKDFIGDLSTWYLRRSRERIKEDDKDAKATLYFVLKTLAKVMAPFAPFAAEDIWLKLKMNPPAGGDAESVHLTEWPKAEKGNAKIIQEMEQVRNIVSEVLMARQSAGIRVRQPLGKLEIQNTSLKKRIELIEVIKDEVNIETITFNEKLVTGFKLDVTITENLKEKGNYRELVRALQDMRKKMGLTPSDAVTLVFETNVAGRRLVQKFETDMKKTVIASKIEFKQNEGNEVKIDNLVFKVKINKI